MRFCQILGVPRATYYRWQIDGTKGPWPAPVVDDIEPLVEKYAGDWPAWGHRKIAAMMRADGCDVSASSALRAMARRGLLQPVDYQRERRDLAAARREAFIEIPNRRNRVWQTDFTEFETSAGGIWRISGAVDYVCKVMFTSRTSMTQTAADAIASIEQAREQAGRWLGMPLIEDLLDHATGELRPIKLVSDNGPAYKAASFASYIAARPEFDHVRTRRRSPHTNGVIERSFGTLKYEHLYREEISNGIVLAAETEYYRGVMNQIRPHEELGFARPLEVYLQDPD